MTNKKKSLIVYLLALVMFGASALASYSTRSVLAQYTDRILRPCGSGATPYASVIATATGNVALTTCVGGSVTINGVPISAGGVTGTGTANILTKWTGAATIGNSGTTDTGTAVTFTAASLTLPVNGIVKPLTNGVNALNFTLADGTTSLLSLDTTNTRVGINNSAPGGNLHINTTGGAGILIDRGAGTAGLQGRRANTSLAAPSAVAATNILFTISSLGYDSATFGIGSQVITATTEAWSTTAHGAMMRFATVANTTTALVDRMVIDEDGFIGIGAVGNPAFLLDINRVATGVITDQSRVVNVSNPTLTFNTTAGVLTNYGGFFANTATRLSGANNLTNVGIYATATGAQVNIAAQFDGAVINNGTLTATNFATTTNCADSAGPAACGSASAGSVVIDTGATTVVISTTAVTANSQIFAIFDASLSARLGVTCNTTVAIPVITARTTGTSFTIAVPVAPITNPLCLSYRILN